MNSMAEQIPRQTHGIWIQGNVRCPVKSILSWGPNHRLWSEKDIDGFKLESHIRVAIERDNLPAAADLMRYEILATIGGVYADADLKLVRPLPDWLFECEAVAAWVNELERPGGLNNAFLGSVPGNQFFVSLVDELAAGRPPKFPPGKTWEVIGPKRLTNHWHATNYRNLTVLPSHFVYPRMHNKLNPEGHVYSGGGPVYCDHQWMTTEGHDLIDD